MNTATDVEHSTPVEEVFLTRTLRARPEFLRSCLYLMIGGWLSFALAAALYGPRWTLQVALAYVVVLIVGPFVLWLCVWSYQVIVDERGVAQRLCGLWSRWPWEDFAAEHVSRDKKNCRLVNRARPWGTRSLRLGLLPEAGIHFLYDLVDSPASLEEAATPAVSIDTEVPAAAAEVLLNWRIFSTLRVDHTGCGFVNGEWWRWEAITEFRLEQDFGRCGEVHHLYLTTSTGRRMQGNVFCCDAFDKLHQSVRGEGDAWLTQLKWLVPAGCWRHHRVKGELSTREEGAYRLRRLDKQRFNLRKFELTFVLFAALYAGVKVVPGIIGLWNIQFMPLGWKLLITFVSMLLISIQPGLAFVVTHNRRRKLCVKEAEIRRQMAELSGFEVNSADSIAVLVP